MKKIIKKLDAANTEPLELSPENKPAPAEIATKSVVSAYVGGQNIAKKKESNIEEGKIKLKYNNKSETKKAPWELPIKTLEKVKVLAKRYNKKGYEIIVELVEKAI